MTNDPEQIRREIERTRTDLSETSTRSAKR